MCNIAGYVGTKQAAPILLDMLKKQEGYGGGYYSGIATMSFSTSRILVTFNDGSIIRFNPGDIEEFKILSNVRRVINEYI